MLNALIVLAGGGGAGEIGLPDVHWIGWLAALMVTGSVILICIVGFLLYKFLFPFLKERGEGIKSVYDRLESERDHEMKAQDDFERKLADIESIAAKRMEQAVKDGEIAARNLVGEAKAQADRFHLRVQRETDLEAKKARIELRKAFVLFSVNAAERMLVDGVDHDVHHGMVNSYLDQLPEVKRT
jgi:ATP synthase F0 subunit b